jgi:hypothetical protein
VEWPAEGAASKLEAGGKLFTSQCMLFWSLSASGQITPRKVAGWKSPHVAPVEQILDLAA